MTEEIVREASPRLREGLRDALVVFLTVRLLLFAISAIGGGLLPVPEGQPPLDAGYPPPALSPGWHMLGTATERQDALWFFRIAEDGYRPDDNSAAFFPLYPLAIRTVSWLPGVGPLAAGLLVSNAAFFASLLLLHALTRFELGRRAAMPSLWLLALFPTAFFLLAPYTESLFLLLSLGSFWFARRGRWGSAALAGALAALTRSVGVLLIPALLVEVLRQWRRDGREPLPGFAACAAIALGPLAYFGYWQVRFHDFWRPLDVQRSWRPTEHVASPLASLWDAADLARHFQTWWLMDLTVVALAIVGLLLIARHVPAAYSVYVVASLALPLMFPMPSRPLLSMPRFVVVLFPAIWGYARVVARRPAAGPAFVGAFAAGFGLLALLFINWQYVF